MQAGVCILEPARTPHRTFEPGIAAGVASALLLARVMESLLFHIDPFDTAKTSSRNGANFLPMSK
jgi:hypothetical protein